MRIESGRLSDVAEMPLRADWSDLNRRLRALEPGESLVISCPVHMTIGRLRSTILVSASRVDYGSWRVKTRTEGQKIHVFLVPTS